MKVSTFVPETDPYLPKPLKVAIPFTAVTVVVPVRLPLLIATVTSSEAVVTRFPDAS